MSNDIVQAINSCYKAPAAPIVRVACGGGVGWVVGVIIIIFFSNMEDGQESIGK
jgi:hypothetical protein